jgi:hypothetical protein
VTVCRMISGPNWPQNLDGMYLFNDSFLCLGPFGSTNNSNDSTLTPAVVDDIVKRGQDLWKSVYRPLDSKLTDKLALSHPDLPVHIIESEYGNLFADPSSSSPNTIPAKVGRVLTSLVAVACLRAQTGVGPQVVSHVFGLRKAFEDGSAEAPGEEAIEGGRWLASDEGSIWLLGTVDRIVDAIGQGQGTTFAPGFKSKL